MSEKAQKVKWTWPPHLKGFKIEFEMLFERGFKTPDCRKPLMIMGERGIGKSAFVEIFEKLYLNEHGKKRVKRVNIAAIPEALIDDALFGHIKGAYTGAISKAPGFVELSDLLILEEIGELPQYVQAKFLTFLEDHIYYPVGSRDHKEAKDIQIIGTTNKRRENFREDFFDRFYDFEIPALHRRRKDILYYAKHFMEDKMKDLTQHELLKLMSFNWPGNVREIEYRIFRDKHASDIYLHVRSKGFKGKPYPFMGIVYHPENLNYPDYKDLEKKLNKHNLSLFENSKKAFKGKIPDNFDDQYEGLKIFCEHTGQDINANENLLDIIYETETGQDQVEIASLTYDEINKLYFEKLLLQGSGNKKAMAKKAGFSRPKLYRMLKKYSLM
jgi:transcriptional regulator with PAS, ATPase and Fis domain